MVAVRKDLEICLGRGSTKIPLLTELRTHEGWRLQKNLNWKFCFRPVQESRGGLLLQPRGDSAGPH